MNPDLALATGRITCLRPCAAQCVSSRHILVDALNYRCCTGLRHCAYAAQYTARPTKVVLF